MHDSIPSKQKSRPDSVFVEGVRYIREDVVNAQVEWLKRELAKKDGVTVETPARQGWPKTLTLPVNRGYVVTDDAPTMCIHGIQLATGEAYRACPKCFALCTRSAEKAP